ncbi:hypothetical protein [Deinococcus soli (ex Cha et al. 2016)]|uniref:Uncharacterized protein n=2 Tax=Deinococcus soli (ex Cha et al. 2016) TaxID=1309411 RepID=A0AAE3XES1_9DEIO|nr:hypothetical protein [Deinococcus soli (ex Cha et al. 2016)]MDR6218383.1 hypothetical protein [Deinococcus soli (ex Cha et al. 2016)]MDR6329123.1 hypothetical protein [Deinococcus soli (ex Cha et al. 2016)]MDR6751396.1 hypothetical protein [Deinococcus soli (ex Cha et al. 2016)]
MTAQVTVHRNLHRHCWSVSAGGRITGHESTCSLRGVLFRVRPGGQSRARRDGQRNVHAFAAGERADVIDVPEGALRFTYRPFETDTFVLDDGTPIAGARLAVFTPGGAFVLDPLLFGHAGALITT